MESLILIPGLLCNQTLWSGQMASLALHADVVVADEIQNLRVISGLPMLRQTALDAVRTWRHKPYLLNVEPVDVQTTIDVVFNLGG
jgi:protein TonB